MPNRVKGKSYLAGSEGERLRKAEVICWTALKFGEGWEVRCKMVLMRCIWVSQGMSRQEGENECQPPGSTQSERMSQRRNRQRRLAAEPELGELRIGKE